MAAAHDFDRLSELIVEAAQIAGSNRWGMLCHFIRTLETELAQMQYGNGVDLIVRRPPGHPNYTGSPKRHLTSVVTSANPQANAAVSSKCALSASPEPLLFVPACRDREGELEDLSGRMVVKFISSSGLVRETREAVRRSKTHLVALKVHVNEAQAAAGISRALMMESRILMMATERYSVDPR